MVSLRDAIDLKTKIINQDIPNATFKVQKRFIRIMSFARHRNFRRQLIIDLNIMPFPVLTFSNV